MDYLKILAEDIHSVSASTVDNEGHPQIRVIDVMHYDEDGLYFLTAKGKEFYSQLIEKQYIAISGLKGKMAITLRGKVRCIGYDKLDLIFEKNPYMKEIYREGTRDALEVFMIYDAEGEICLQINTVKDSRFIDSMQAVIMWTRLKQKLQKLHADYSEQIMHMYSLIAVQMQTSVHTGQYSMLKYRSRFLRKWV